jgi:hypothetical protein
MSQLKDKHKPDPIWPDDLPQEAFFSFCGAQKLKSEQEEQVSRWRNAKVDNCVFDDPVEATQKRSPPNEETSSFVFVSMFEPSTGTD